MKIFSDKNNKILFYCVVIITLACCLLLSACRFSIGTQNDETSANETKNPVFYGVTVNDINTIILDSPETLHQSIKSFFTHLVGSDEFQKKNISHDLLDEKHRFFAPVIIADYRNQKENLDFDLFTFRKNLLVSVGKNYDINIDIVEIRLNTL